MEEEEEEEEEEWPMRNRSKFFFHLKEKPVQLLAEADDAVEFLVRIWVVRWKRPHSKVVNVNRRLRSSHILPSRKS